MKITVIILVIAVLILPAGVLAHGEEAEVLQSTVTAEQRQQAAKEFRDQLIAGAKEELTEARAQRMVTRCAIIKAKTAQSTERLLAIRDQRGGLINSLATRLETFSERAKAANLDTAALDEDVAALKTMAGELDALWATYAEKLEAVKDADCTESADALHEALEAAKTAGADIRAKFKEAKDFLQSDIKPELQHLREDLAGQPAG